jgi:enoyl-CoA hydratase/carnithine racemase
MSEAVKIGREGATLNITLNQGEQGNLISREMADTIMAALLSVAPEVTLAVMRAEGPDFCRGRANVMPPKGTAQPAIELRRVLATPVLEFYAAFRKCAVPVLTVVQGKALGVGCALAALGDITVAADDATFQVPEMERDLPPSLVMTALNRKVTGKTIARLVLTTDTIGAAEAQRLGIVDIVVPKAKLADEHKRIVTQFGKYTPPTVRTIKEFIRVAPEMSASALDEAAGGLQSVSISPRFMGG